MTSEILQWQKLTPRSVLMIRIALPSSKYPAIVYNLARRKSRPIGSPKQRLLKWF